MWASSTPIVALFWCVVLFSSSCCSSGVGVLQKPATQLNKRWKAITQLRTVGRSNLKAHKYQQASLCYSAILQLVEGAHESRYVDVRRRCGVLLGRCEETLGNTHHAIARCSEVINEAPEITPAYNPRKIYASTSLEDAFEDDLGAHDACIDVGEAHYCRARCLRAINEPLLALTDLQESLKYLPDEDAIYQDIAQIELELLQRRQPVEPPRATETILLPDTHPNDELTSQNKTDNTTTATTAITPSTNITSENVVTDGVNATEGAQSEHRIDFLEHCLLNYPSLVFTKKQVRTLCALAKRSSSIAPRVRDSEGAKITSLTPLPPSPLQDLLGNLVPGGMNGANSLGNRGAGDSANAIGSLMGPLNPSMNNMNGGKGMKMSMDTVISMLPLLSSFIGMSSDTSHNVAEILRAVSKVYSMLSSVYKRVVKHREVIVAVLTVLWVVVTAVSALNTMLYG